jgi:hypothetical protein
MELWEALLRTPPPDTYAYKFLSDGERRLEDPRNPRTAHDGHGGFDGVLVVERGATRPATSPRRGA